VLATSAKAAATHQVAANELIKKARRITAAGFFNFHDFIN
jgi:hypothetical protein